MKRLPIIALLAVITGAGALFFFKTTIHAQGQKPFSVGKIDVSIFSGLRPGEPEATVTERYGPGVTEQHSLYKRYGKDGPEVGYENGVVKRVKVTNNDPDPSAQGTTARALLDLFGHSDQDAIALLGPPSVVTGGPAPHKADYTLYWLFAMPGRPAPQKIMGQQTLVLNFHPGTGCYSIAIVW